MLNRAALFALVLASLALSAGLLASSVGDRDGAPRTPFEEPESDSSDGAASPSAPERRSGSEDLEPLGEPMFA
jgi:hypothetical protein